MAIFAGQYFPAGGEVGSGGGILQVKSGHRTGDVSISQNNASTYKNLLVVSITPTRSDSKILVMGNADGVSHRNSTNFTGEWEGWLAYNPNNTNNDGAPTAWTTSLGMITGLGGWGAHGQAGKSSMGFNFIHEPNTTNACYYSLTINRRTQSWFNNEYNSHKGTSIILMEISS
mgnify:CR=1 FL=1|tara:strand:- start:533 stop:1051 length:519 start_codon:yes stop_codon:yes gene_type:complete